MRKLKFRGWDIIRSQTLSNRDLWDIPYNEIFIHTPDQRALNIMQYTGLKDENGEEIYEGDLVKINGKLYMIKYEIGSMMLVRCSVNTNMYEEFKNCWNDDVYPISQYYWENDCEEDTLVDCIVIGNIFENKELLEGDKNE